MAASDYPLAAAIKAVKSGMSARAGLAAYRAGGGSIRDATWYRTVAEVRRTIGDSLQEATRGQNRKPSGDEITVLTTKRQAQFIQQVSVFVRDRATGEVEARPFSWRTKSADHPQASRQGSVGRV